MISKITWGLLTVGGLSFGVVQAAPAHALPTANAPVPKPGAKPGKVVPVPTAPTSLPPVTKSSNVPPAVVMDQFYNYLNQSYSLWLGDDRGACSYAVDPTSVKKDGDDRFFLAKISRGRVGTGCRGVLAFQIMQANCKTQTLYQFQREQKDDMRLAGWERFETMLHDPTVLNTDKSKNQSAAAVKAICAL